LQDEWQLYQGQGFLQVISRPRIEAANNAGQWPNPALSSPLFGPGTFQGREYARILQSIGQLETDLAADPRIPAKAEGRSAYNYMAWKLYRETAPGEWRRYADRVLEIRERFYQFLYANVEQVNRAMTTDGEPIPHSWDKAIESARQLCKWAGEQVEKQGADHAQDREFIANRRATASQARNLSELFARLLAEAEHASVSRAFDAGECADIYTLIDDNIVQQVFSQHFHMTYRNVWIDRAKPLLARDTATLSPVAYSAARAICEFDAGQATLQVGGQPRGWCHNFIDGKPNAIMLLQIPSNDLVNLAFGDASDFVVSIAASDLRRLDFGKAFIDVSN